MTVIASGMDGASVGLERNVPPPSRASGESLFTPLFDIVKHTTTEGPPPFLPGLPHAVS
jgi:hypothetical protein